jgi:hypothetical protein
MQLHGLNYQPLGHKSKGFTTGLTRCISSLSCRSFLCNNYNPVLSSTRLHHRVCRGPPGIPHGSAPAHGSTLGKKESSFSMGRGGNISRMKWWPIMIIDDTKVLGFDQISPNFGEIRPFRWGPKRILRFTFRKFTELSPKFIRIFFRNSSNSVGTEFFFQNESQNLGWYWYLHFCSKWQHVFLLKESHCLRRLFSDLWFLTSAVQLIH